MSFHYFSIKNRNFDLFRFPISSPFSLFRFCAEMRISSVVYLLTKLLLVRSSKRRRVCRWTSATLWGQILSQPALGVCRFWFLVYDVFLCWELSEALESSFEEEETNCIRSEHDRGLSYARARAHSFVSAIAFCFFLIRLHYCQSLIDRCFATERERLQYIIFMIDFCCACAIWEPSFLVKTPRKSKSYQ